MKTPRIAIGHIELLRNKVLFELENLKKIATQEEIKKLNITKLKPDEPSCCIYGQMSGNCYNSRASELIYFSANGISLDSVGEDALIYSKKPAVSDGWDKFRIKKFYKRNQIEDYESFFVEGQHTPLEWWIVNRPKDNSNIIKFLRGQLKVITLS